MDKAAIAIEYAGQSYKAARKDVLRFGAHVGLRKDGIMQEHSTSINERAVRDSCRRMMVVARFENRRVDPFPGYSWMLH